MVIYERLYALSFEYLKTHRNKGHALYVNFVHCEANKCTHLHLLIHLPPQHSHTYIYEFTNFKSLKLTNMRNIIITT